MYWLILQKRSPDRDIPWPRQLVQISICFDTFSIPLSLAFWSMDPSQQIEPSDARFASSKKAPWQRGVCVNHLNRCKTSSGLAGILSITAGSQILSVGKGWLVCRGTQHFTGTVSNEAASEMGYPAWPAGCTCNVIISISVFLSMATG